MEITDILERVITHVGHVGPWEIIDITTPLRTGLAVWPGHTPPQLAVTHSHQAGDGVQLTHLSLGAHTGTHLDAPRHFIPDGGLVTDLDLSVLMGNAQVISYRGTTPIPVSWLESQNLANPPSEHFPKGKVASRLLIRFERNEGLLEKYADFDEGYAAISPEAAEWLVERGLQLIGTDYLAIGPYHDGPTGGNREVHLTLLGAGVVIVEGLDLRRAEPGYYTLVCLPLLIPADGAPCRAVLLPPVPRDYRRV